MKNITEEELRDLYVVQGKSDREIAELTGMNRTAIVYKRQNCGIETRPSTMSKVQTVAGNWLLANGYTYEHIRAKNKLAAYDYLVEGNIRLQVLSGRYNTKKKRYFFTFTQSASTGVKESDTRIRLRSGRMRKLYRKTCDVILFVGVKEDEFEFWCVPSHFISDELTTMSMRADDPNPSYMQYNDTAFVIEELLRKKSDLA